MTRTFVWLLTFSSWALFGCASRGTATQSYATLGAGTPSCDIADASPWINRWFDAWAPASTEVLHLPEAPPPNMVFYDSACVYNADLTHAYPLVRRPPSRLQSMRRNHSA